MQPNIKDPIQYAREVVGGDPFAAYLGIVIEDVREGYARLSLKIRPEYLNAVGRAHGGAIGMILDQAFAVAANSRGISAVSLTMTIHYHAGAPQDSTLIAEACPIDIKNKVSTWDIVCRTRENNTLIATSRGTAFHQG